MWFWFLVLSSSSDISSFTFRKHFNMYMNILERWRFLYRVANILFNNIIFPLKSHFRIFLTTDVGVFNDFIVFPDGLQQNGRYEVIIFIGRNISKYALFCFRYYRITDISMPSISASLRFSVEPDEVLSLSEPSLSTSVSIMESCVVTCKSTACNYIESIL